MAHPKALSTKASIHGMGYESFGQALFKYVKSTHILHLSLAFFSITTFILDIVSPECDWPLSLSRSPPVWLPSSPCSPFSYFSLLVSLSDPELSNVIENLGLFRGMSTSVHA